MECEFVFVDEGENLHRAPELGITGCSHRRSLPYHAANEVCAWK